MPISLARSIQEAELLVEDEQRRLLAASTAATTNCRASRDLPAPAGPMTRVLEPCSTPPPKQRVELADAAGEHIAREARLVLGRDQAREDLHATCRRW